MDNWISTDEKLPEEEGKYLVCHHFYLHVTNKDYFSMFVSNFKLNRYRETNEKFIDEEGITGGFQDDNAYSQKVTHWQPLPEPPK